eukprot:TRINITY_DN29483_c0_g1_i1.p1 TRINITY_DN29483_c0_g1~~TRINITY_DN29483_c0_g1_i1.p1  ORF type:complete len:172 (-),score=26.76 TRINITY_DN29483_c0_g1_i1:332-847(-)
MRCHWHSTNTIFDSSSLDMPAFQLQNPSLRLFLSRPITPRFGAAQLAKHGAQKFSVQASMGIEKELIRPGNGPLPTKGQQVTVHCTGYGKDRDLSKKFWSTKDPGQKPFEFKVGLGQVIKGWDEGVMGMHVGEIARLKCSPDYAYGAGGFPAWGIQPNSVLLFEIEVLKVD